MIRMTLALGLLAINAVAADAAPTLPSPRPPASWMDNRDVPPGVLKRGERVQIGAALAVSPDGRVIGCEITQPSQYSALNDHACAFYRERGEFRPARDDAGKPTSGTYEAVAIWEAFDTATDAATSKAVAPKPAANVYLWVTTEDLPKGVLEPDDVVVSALTITVSANGRVAACSAPVPSRIPALDQYACRLVTARGHYKPARDAAGVPVESLDWRRIRWQVPKD